MEQAHGTPIASHFASKDVIISMPDNVITDIMNRLPIRDAVRSGILSRKWRFKWTILTQLVFDKEFSKYLQGPEGKESYDGRIISRLLLNIKGPITKFVLYIPNNTVLDVEDINHWVMFLSKKGIKEFELTNRNKRPIKLPTHLFSCRELECLKLDNCCFQPPTSFCGFPNLNTLRLSRVTFESGSCWELITLCPLLVILEFMHFAPIVKVNLTEIAELENLKSLSLSLSVLYNTVITSSSIFQLGSYLPNLERLRLDFAKCELLGGAGPRKGFHTAFPCLKKLGLQPIDFSSGDMLSCVFGMIWSLPKLQSLLIAAKYKDATPPPAFCYSDVYNMKGQLQLVTIECLFFRCSENEICLIKSLLACSPFLRKIDILVDRSSQVFGGENGKLMFATKLLELPRASTLARVSVTWA